MALFTYTLTIDTVFQDIPESLADALFEAGLDDALLAIENGRMVIDVDREAVDLTEAILSAIHQVRSVGLQVLRVEPATQVTTIDIANYVGRTRQNVQQWVTGKRGGGAFPKPVVDGRNGTRLWRWEDVLGWLKQRALVSAEAHREFVNREEVIGAINGMLSARRLNQDGYNVVPLFSLVADSAETQYKTQSSED